MNALSKYCCQQQQQEKCYLTLKPLLFIRSQSPNIITCHHSAAESTLRRNMILKAIKTNPQNNNPTLLPSLQTWRGLRLQPYHCLS